MKQIEAWLKDMGFKGDLSELTPDASLRRYYRLDSGIQHVVVMDASRQKASIKPFVDIASRLYDAKIKAPRVLAQNHDEGWLVLEDLGSTHLLDVIDETNFEALYRQGIDTILRMQQIDPSGLPYYHADFLREEMRLMPEWYLRRYLGQAIGAEMSRRLASLYEVIIETVLLQPQGCFVHRDFHSRNLLLTPQDQLAVIDFQDARSGAITYDLVSLLRDCYVVFEPAVIERLALQFRDKSGLDVADEIFMRWFDFTGIQRHLKVLGIFARLALRDGKRGYLGETPRVYRYLLEIASKYPELTDLIVLLSQKEST
jgi:N-acetylmuramate 1-kinase